MSSSNRVRLAAIPETVYGETPGAGDFTTLRFTSEDLSGTPQTVESAFIRSDRQNAGQINTGLEVAGGVDFEVSADASMQLAIEHAMMSNIVGQVNHTGTLDITGSGTQLDTDGNFVSDGITVGDMLQLGGFSNANNNTVVMVTGVTTGQLTIVGEGLTDESGGGGETAQVPAHFTVGTVEKSLSLSKEFLDLGTRSIAYRGMRVNELSMTFAFGSIVTGRFAMVGNGYETPALPITNSRTVNAAGSDPSLDASNGFGWLLIDDIAADICLESLGFTLNNNMQAQNCIGNLAPTNQIPGSAQVTFDSTIHLSGNAFDTFMAAKIAQTPMRMAFYSRDENNNGYGVVMERVQTSFPDPAAGGGNTPVTFNATGTASYDSTAGETMRIYILT